jgi:hypothetical protein
MIHKISDSEWASINWLAVGLGVTPELVAKMISVETAGTFSPTIENPISHAKGIFQWTRGTAKDLGFADQFDLVRKNPDFASQIKVAYKHFKRYGPFGNDYEFVLSNFLPAYRHRPSSTTLYSLKPTYAQQNPGINTLGDYYSLVAKRQISRGVGNGFTSVPMLIALAAVTFFLSVGSCTVEHTEKIRTTYLPVNILKETK